MLSRNPSSMADLRCADASMDSPLASTAPRTRRWWLIEDSGPWGSHAVRESSLAWLDRHSSRSTEDARVVFIRRHDRHHRRAGLTRRIFTFAPGDQTVLGRTIALHDEPDIDDLTQAPTEQPWTVCRDHPMVIVCTNGSRDRCCAQRGRAVLDSLPVDVLGHVWESTHLGGHRFAPVALTVPSGYVLGRVTTQSLIDIVRADRLELTTLRGRSDLSAPEQIGELSARRHWGLVTTGTHLEVTTQSCSIGGTREVSVAAIAVTAPDGRIHHVSVHSRQTRPTVSSCGDQPAPVTVWEER